MIEITSDDTTHFALKAEQLSGHIGLSFEQSIEALCRWEMAGETCSGPIWRAKYYGVQFSWFPKYLNEFRTGSFETSAYL